MSRKYFILGLFIGLGLLFAFFKTLPDGKLHLVFCNVGQGDASYIRLPNNQDILIDGGPDDKVLSCLGRHMPFYDRTIDMVFLSHPQADHLNGLVSVLERYSVKYYSSGPEGNTTAGYQKLKKLITDKNIIVRNLYAGDRIGFGDVFITGIWPSREWIAGKLENNNLVEGNSNRVLGASTSYKEINDFSEVLLLTFGRFDALFTGDADSHIQPEILNANPYLTSVKVLKTPHHGSRTGIFEAFLEKVKPSLAVISVGKNSYGHPSPEIIGRLKTIGSQILRTDQGADVEIISDGKDWWKKE